MARERNTFVAYLLWLIFGIFGAHKLYLRRPIMALVYLCTAGLFVIGWIVDLFTMVEQVAACNDRIYDESEESLFMEEQLDRIDELEDQVDEPRDRLCNL